MYASSVAATLVAVLVSPLALSLQAVTYIVPSDAELIQKSDDIVVATGVSSALAGSWPLPDHAKRASERGATIYIASVAKSIVDQSM